MPPQSGPYPASTMKRPGNCRCRFNAPVQDSGRRPESMAASTGCCCRSACWGRGTRLRPGGPALIPVEGGAGREPRRRHVVSADEAVPVRAAAVFFTEPKVRAALTRATPSSFTV